MLPGDSTGINNLLLHQRIQVSCSKADSVARRCVSEGGVQSEPQQEWLCLRMNQTDYLDELTLAKPRTAANKAPPFSFCVTFHLSIVQTCRACCHKQRNWPRQRCANNSEKVINNTKQSNDASHRMSDWRTSDAEASSCACGIKKQRAPVTRSEYKHRKTRGEAAAARGVCALEILLTWET